MALSKIQSESINLADTFAFTGTVSGAGGDNTPVFSGRKASAQTLTRGAFVKITGFTTDEVDTDNAFDGTTFTVPSGKAGTYFLTFQLYGDYTAVGNDGRGNYARIYRNGSDISTGQLVLSGANIQTLSVKTSVIYDLSVGDTIEVYGYLSDDSAGDARVQINRTNFGGYRIIT